MIAFSMIVGSSYAFAADTEAKSVKVSQIKNQIQMRPSKKIKGGQ